MEHNTLQSEKIDHFCSFWVNLYSFRLKFKVELRDSIMTCCHNLSGDNPSYTGSDHTTTTSLPSSREEGSSLQVGFADSMYLFKSTVRAVAETKASETADLMSAGSSPAVVTAASFRASSEMLASLGTKAFRISSLPAKSGASADSISWNSFWKHMYLINLCWLDDAMNLTQCKVVEGCIGTSDCVRIKLEGYMMCKTMWIICSTSANHKKHKANIGSEYWHVTEGSDSS